MCHCRGLRKSAKETQVPLSGRSARQDHTGNVAFQLGPLNFKIHSHSNVALQSADKSKEEEDMKIWSPHEGLLSHVNVAAHAGVDVWSS